MAEERCYNVRGLRDDDGVLRGQAEQRRSGLCAVQELLEGYRARRRHDGRALPRLLRVFVRPREVLPGAVDQDLLRT